MSPNQSSRFKRLMNQPIPTKKPNMAQHRKDTSSRMELQDLFTSNLNDSVNASQRNHSWQGVVINVNEGYLGNNLANNCNISISNEESKIRAELEDDVEKDLEEEIKNGICHFALRLHKLYQHQSDRNGRELSKNSIKTRSLINNKTFTEVKITIRMDAGGSQIEINEIKKASRRPQTSISEGKDGKVFPSTKTFNWVDTLRSGSSPAAIINKKHEMSHGTARAVRNVHDPKPYVRERRNWKGASTDHKKNALELGWS